MKKDVTPFHSGRKIIIATMHGKEAVMKPVLEKEFGMECVLLNGFNTDQFGTFTREIKRENSQIQTLKKKAAEALRFSGSDLVMVSEGSFGMHPSFPFAPSNIEMVMILDSRFDLEIVGIAVSPDTNMNGTYVSSAEEALRMAYEWGFPEHGVILRLRESFPYFIQKELRSEEELLTSVKKMLRFPGVRRVYLETDMRAHRNPKRMSVISAALEDLVIKMKSPCPNCNSPGFAKAKYEGRKNCYRCRMLTDEPLMEVWQCNSCRFQEKELIGETSTVDPMRCPYCNP